MALFKQYTLFLYRRYPAYKVSARRSIMIPGDSLEELMQRAQKLQEKKRSPWGSYSFIKAYPEIVTLATFDIL